MQKVKRAWQKRSKTVIGETIMRLMILVLTVTSSQWIWLRAVKVELQIVWSPAWPTCRPLGWEQKEGGRSHPLWDGWTALHVGLDVLRDWTNSGAEEEMEDQIKEIQHMLTTPISHNITTICLILCWSHIDSNRPLKLCCGNCTKMLATDLSPVKWT